MYATCLTQDIRGFNSINIISNIKNCKTNICKHHKKNLHQDKEFRESSWRKPSNLFKKLSSFNFLLHLGHASIIKSKIYTDLSICKWPRAHFTDAESLFLGVSTIHTHHSEGDKNIKNIFNINLLKCHCQCLAKQ